MDLKKLQAFDSLVPSQPTKVNNPSVAGVGPSFKDTLSDKIGNVPNATLPNPAGALKKAFAADGVKFSNHAVDRMRTRGISYGPEDIAKINDAVSRAAAKGSKDSLILMDDSALIVSVKNNTVVTVMDKSALKENVFTNIDSTIVL